jgi:hypothetical protein
MVDAHRKSATDRDLDAPHGVLGRHAPAPTLANLPPGELDDRFERLDRDLAVSVALEQLLYVSLGAVLPDPRL